MPNNLQQDSDQDGNGSANLQTNSGARPTAAQIQDWLIDYLADEMQTPPETIDVYAPFETFAIDSAAAVGMTGDLEEWLGCRVDPILAYDYPTIDAMAKHLAEAGN